MLFIVVSLKNKIQVKMTGVFNNAGANYTNCVEFLDVVIFVNALARHLFFRRRVG